MVFLNEHLKIVNKFGIAVNIAMKNILAKRRIKLEKTEDENSQLFILKSYKLQILITKT